MYWQIKGYEHRQHCLLFHACCTGKLKFSMLGGSSFSASVKQYHSVAEAQSLQPAQPSNQAAGAATTGMAAPAIGPLGAAVQELQQAVAQVQMEPVEGGTSHTAQAQGGSTQVVVRHPRSHALAQGLPEPEKQFRLMASIADTNAPDVQRKTQGSSAPAAAAQQQGNEPAGARQSTGADALATDDGSSNSCGSLEVSNLEIARFCKLHVELDRCMAAREDGYAAALFRLLNSGSMAKGDLIVGVPLERSMWKEVADLLQV